MLSHAARRPFVRLVPSVVSPEIVARPFSATLTATSVGEIAIAWTLLAAAVVPVGAFLLVLLTAALG
jgi:hypothetical protein